MRRPRIKMLAIRAPLLRVVVTPDALESVRPAECVVSLPIVKAGEVDTSCSEGIRRSFCHRIHFFADRAQAEQWARMTRFRRAIGFAFRCLRS